jgi:hypothetical protein
MMPRAICEDCGSLVEAELTHNGICAVGHYVHCGWGHQLSPDDLISDDAAEIISKLETKLAKAVEALDEAVYLLKPDEKDMMRQAGVYRIVTTLAEIKGESHE